MTNKGIRLDRPHGEETKLLEELKADWKQPQFNYSCQIRLKDSEIDLADAVPGIKILAAVEDNLLIALPASSRQKLNELHALGLIPAPDSQVQLKLKELARESADSGDPDLMPDARRLFQ